METKDLAVKIAEFIQYNEIDVKLVPIKIIIKEYFEAQLKACDNAGNQLFNELINN